LALPEGSIPASSAPRLAPILREGTEITLPEAS